MRILVLNPNTSTAITARLAATARAAAAPGTIIIADQPLTGVPAVQGWADGHRSVVAALELLEVRTHDFDAVIWAGFGDVGREALQEVLAVPVVGITEAGATIAGLLGRQYAIVTTLARMIPLIEEVLRPAGLLTRCATILSVDLAVLADPGELRHATAVTAAAAIDRGADVVCLGSGAMAGWATALSRELNAPVIDPVAAAVGLAEALVRTTRTG